MSLLRGKFDTRTIRNGTVKFFGKKYKVTWRTEPDCNGFQEPPYDGRLDGLRGLFYSHGESFPHLINNIYLHSFGYEYPGPNCIDGHFVWEKWEVVE